LGETLGLSQTVGGLLVLGGIYLANKQRVEKEKVATSEVFHDAVDN